MCYAGLGLVTQSCPALCDPMDCSPPGSSVREILQARILEWAATPSFRGSSWTRDQTHVSYISCIDRQVLYHQHHHSPNRVSPVFLWWLLQTSQGCAILHEASFPLQGFCPPSNSVQSLPPYSPQSPSPHPLLNPLSRLLSMAYRLSLTSFRFKIKISFILNTHFSCCPLSRLHSFPNSSPPRLSLIPSLPHAHSSVSSSLALVQTHQGQWQHSFQGLRWPPLLCAFLIQMLTCSSRGAQVLLQAVSTRDSKCSPSGFLPILLAANDPEPHSVLFPTPALAFETLLFSLGRLPLPSLIHSWI